MLCSIYSQEKIILKCIHTGSFSLLKFFSAFTWECHWISFVNKLIVAKVKIFTEKCDLRSVI